ALEGARYNVRVNCIAPTAATGMTEGILTPESLDQLPASAVSPAVVALLGEAAPNKSIVLSGGGSIEAAHITMTRGIVLGDAHGMRESPELIVERFDEIADRTDERVPSTGFEQ